MRLLPPYRYSCREIRYRLRTVQTRAVRYFAVGCNIKNNLVHLINLSHLKSSHQNSIEFTICSFYDLSKPVQGFVDLEKLRICRLRDLTKQRSVTKDL